MARWQLTDVDHQLITREIVPFLPDRIFDAHAHLFTRAHYTPNPPPAYFDDHYTTFGLAEYHRLMAWLHPERQISGGLFFGLAFTGDRAANNAFVAAEIAAAAPDPVYGALVVAPDDDPDHVRDEIRRGGWRGLKCYHTMAQVAGPSWLAPIEAYLPESLVQIANEAGLTITLHMVRDRALADPANQQTIRRYCERYPDMRLILAHAARGFNPWHTIEGIDSLRGLANVYFDTSVVTEAGAFEAIIETFGHQRLLYGTDFPVSHVRGRCVAVGDSFHWLYADDMDLDAKHMTLRPVLIGIEALRSLRLACHRMRLTDRQLEDVFFNNAVQLFI
ncbi:MAG TPA: amidohydrolase family protein [Roseiflexaceae bacterium]|nr:amidohydrolase family protein [Roseiflexaceae bacterium]HMP38948.1 amidohydrolase family protein [Roseiflexaceae bacterium]